MKRSAYTVIIFSTGIAVGWLSNDFKLFKESIPSNNGLSEQMSPEVSIKIDDNLISEQKRISKSLLDERTLSSPQLDKLVELFKLDMTSDEKSQLDGQLIRYAKSLLSKSQDNSKTESQLLTIANIASVRYQVLPVLISFYEKIDKIDIAIGHLYELRGVQSFDDDYQQVTKRIKVLIAKQVKQLKHANQKEELVNFYQFILDTEPDNYEVQMQFAELEFNNQHYENAIRLLSVLVYHPELEQQALQLLQRTQYQMDRKSRGDVPVPVTKKGEQYVVNAIINDLEPVKLMLDTGASMTILSPEIINSFGSIDESSQDVMRFSTANGELYAPIVVVDKITIHGYSVNDIQVGVLPSFPMGSIDGLLGMNFLSQFSFFIDQQNLVLQLNNIEP